MDRFVVLCSNYAFKSLSQKILKYYYSSAHITLCAFNVSYIVDYKKGTTNNISDKKVQILNIILNCAYYKWFFSILWNSL